MVASSMLILLAEDTAVKQAIARRMLQTLGDSGDVVAPSRQQVLRRCSTPSDDERITFSPKAITAAEQMPTLSPLLDGPITRRRHPSKRRKRHFRTVRILRLQAGAHGHRGLPGGPGGAG